jgi:glycosyltransferase involved in cell wall biosynthesis
MASPPESLPPPGTIVLATRNRAAILPATLERLLALPDGWPIIVVDDVSVDGTAETVASRFPEVQVITLATRRGAAARNVGTMAATTEIVAFADDDSWYAPGALRRAAQHLDEHPDVGLIAARCIVEPDGRIDPVTCAQQDSPLPSSAPGPSIMGFLACTAIARRRAFLGVGGFNEVLGFVGEEELLAIDLRAAGWRLVHASDVLAHHQPSLAGPARPARRALALRNRALTRWLRRPLRRAAATTGALALRAPVDADCRRAMAGVARRLPAALADRRLVPESIESDIRTLEALR